MKAIDHGLVAIGKHAGIADLHLVYTGHRNDFSVIAFVLILVELLALLVAHAGGIPHGDHVQAIGELPEHRCRIPIAGHALLVIRPGKLVIRFRYASRLSGTLQNRFLCVTHGIFGIGFGVQIKKEIDVIRYRIRDFGLGSVTAGTFGLLLRILPIAARPATRAADKHGEEAYDGYASSPCTHIQLHHRHLLSRDRRALMGFRCLFFVLP